MTPRFFSETPIDPPRTTLAATEHHHMIKVMRLGVGDRVTLFDDSGSEFSATIASVGRNASQLEIEQRHDIDRELPFGLTLAVALPKGDRQQWLIEKAVELGVRAVIPLMCDHGVAQPREGALKRLRKWVIAASKQSGRNRLMQILPPQDAAAIFAAGKALIAHPDPQAANLAKLFSTRPYDEDVLLAVGPEGGFSSDEVATGESANCTFFQLGPRILRVETAALAAVAGIVLGRPQT